MSCKVDDIYGQALAAIPSVISIGKSLVVQYSVVQVAKLV